jgi:hypothetical protein
VVKVPHSEPNPAPPTQVNPLALSVEELARMLSAVGGKKITAEALQADIDAGAPVGAGSKLNLVHYAAWLLREVQAA